MLPPKLTLTGDQQQLLKLYKSLDEHQQRTLLDFAAFLSSRGSTETIEPAVSVEPLAIERPEEESVVAAMKRLTATYPMLDTAPLLNDASTLMGAHLMGGKAAGDVIDELQVLFEEAYVVYRKRD
ncbi:MAG: Crp/Fnr family transcriptional regulator [bacterium]